MDNQLKKMEFADIKENKHLFLTNYNIREDFEASGCDWDCLMAIGEDFESRRSGYFEAVQKYITDIAKFPQIHSYRYRVKETGSLIKKIITKTCTKQETINVDNYRVKITDLVGIRVLYVFKSDYYPIHEKIWEKYEHQKAENIHIKLREGDDKSIYKEVLKNDPMIELNSTYRSIHYTLYINEKDLYDARLEIQTRSIFEEGWSEINHKLVYKNKGVADYLILNEASRILSALVGDCDSLGELMKNIHSEYLQKLSDKEKSHVDDEIPRRDNSDDDILSEVLQRFIKS